MGRHDEVTDETYATYAPLVAAAGKRALPRYRLAVALVAAAPGHQPPTLEQFQEAWQARQTEHRAAVEEATRLAERDADAVRDYVTQVRAETGAGPTWTGLAAHLEWPDHLKDRIVRHLNAAGVVRFTSAPRSLDVVEPNRNT